MYPEGVQGVSTHLLLELSQCFRGVELDLPYLYGSSFGSLEVTEDMCNKFSTAPQNKGKNN